MGGSSENGQTLESNTPEIRKVDFGQIYTPKDLTFVHKFDQNLGDLGFTRSQISGIWGQVDLVNLVYLGARY